uniref:Transmembrane protein n=1 Tax=Zooxanthella nutricula TaxID=1333877 RepID=A0A6U6QM53_9DINO|mmetsp:Transcript_66664/g.203926  ORF Transcript_66664/g.203926 Transcript_66664/m.203926 type:complete len:379 (+) Transcript_66664:85-1221(+)
MPRFYQPWSMACGLVVLHVASGSPKHGADWLDAATSPASSPTLDIKNATASSSNETMTAATTQSMYPTNTTATSTITTTTSTTTTSMSASSTATTSAAAIDLTKTIVRGVVLVNASSPEVFVNDPHAKRAVVDSIGFAVGIPLAHVNLYLKTWLRRFAARRLREPASVRRLRMTNVRIDYQITLPAERPPELTATGSSIVAALMADGKEQRLQEQLVTRGLPRMYDVEVLAVLHPQVERETRAPPSPWPKGAAAGGVATGVVVVACLGVLVYDCISKRQAANVEAAANGSTQSAAFDDFAPDELDDVEPDRSPVADAHTSPSEVEVVSTSACIAAEGSVSPWHIEVLVREDHAVAGVAGASKVEASASLGTLSDCRNK